MRRHWGHCQSGGRGLWFWCLVLPLVSPASIQCNLHKTGKTLCVCVCVSQFVRYVFAADMALGPTCFWGEEDRRKMNSSTWRATASRCFWGHCQLVLQLEWECWRVQPPRRHFQKILWSWRWLSTLGWARWHSAALKDPDMSWFVDVSTCHGCSCFLSARCHLPLSVHKAEPTKTMWRLQGPSTAPFHLNHIPWPVAPLPGSVITRMAAGNQCPLSVKPFPCTTFVLRYVFFFGNVNHTQIQQISQD